MIHNNDSSLLTRELALQDQAGSFKQRRDKEKLHDNTSR
jgi:hypothetical protein